MGAVFLLDEPHGPEWKSFLQGACILIFAVALMTAFETGGWAYAKRNYERPMALMIFAHACVLLGNFIGACVLWLFADVVGHKRRSGGQIQGPPAVEAR